ncbi:hypothetical protein [Flagellimonas sp.]
MSKKKRIPLSKEKALSDFEKIKAQNHLTNDQSTVIFLIEHYKMTCTAN